VMELEYLLACLAGTLLGYVIGLLPGLGASLAMIMLFSTLMKIKVITVLVFYCCLISAAQYGGSVSVLSMGIPNEQNSLPLLKIRNDIMMAGQQTHALFLCAVGHLFGAVLTFAFSYLIIDIIADSTGYLRTQVLIAVSLIGILLSCLVSDSRWAFIIASCVIAWVLAKVGLNLQTHEKFLTFDNPYLASGLPRVAIIMGVFAVPKIIDVIQNPLPKSVDINMPVAKMSELVQHAWSRASSIAVGAVTGFFSGLIPFIGIDLSAYLAFYLEKMRTDDRLRHVIAAETATNAAGISVLLPLLIYGIAIMPSEVFLLEITNTSTYVINWINVKPMFPVIAFWLIVANFVCFIFSWNLAVRIMRVVASLGWTLPWLMLLVCCYSIWSVGLAYGAPYYYLTVMAVFSVIGYVFRREDWLPFLIVFMLHHQLEPAIMRMWIIYS